MQFFYDLLAGAWAWPALTPSVARAIIRADAGKACHGWLNLAPIERGSSQACIEDYGWTACAGAVDMESIAPNIHESAWRGVVSGVNCARNGLVEQPQDQKTHEERTANAQQTQKTLFDRPTWA
jgi:hypothetical protein